MKFLVILFLFFSSLNAQFFEDYKDFAQLMKYETDYDTARKKALQEKKLLFVFFVKDGCPFCSKMEDEILTDKDVRKYIKQNYIPLVINQYDGRYPKFLDSYIAPVSYVIDPKDEKIVRKIVGYMEVDQYLWQF
ncbi:MAG: thioredoxin fold domain-containing protein [Epsilonproteobacteria bacterium]|nr:thioredoxin fold domain-containing protein [Campylobacterota bacterium]